MGVTEPLPPAFFDAVGWRERETLSDVRPVFVYAQRTRTTGSPSASAADTRIPDG